MCEREPHPVSRSSSYWSRWRFGMSVAIAIPAFLNMQRRSAVRAAAGEFRSIFASCRSRAITRGFSSGVKFSKAGDGWLYTLYDDGNDNGIRNDDITTGADPRRSVPKRMLDHSSLASVGLPATEIKDPDGDPLPPHEVAGAVSTRRPSARSRPWVIDSGQHLSHRRCRRNVRGPTHGTYRAGNRASL